MSNCAGWREVGPVTVSTKDKLTEDTKRSIVKLNTYGEKQSCWSSLN